MGRFALALRQISSQDRFCRPKDDTAFRAVDDDTVAGLGQPRDVVKTDDRWDAQRASDDRRVRSQPPGVGRESQNALEVQLGYGRRPDVFCDDNNVLIELR